jgi:hypothetical protein
MGGTFWEYLSMTLPYRAPRASKSARERQRIQILERPCNVLALSLTIWMRFAYFTGLMQVAAHVYRSPRLQCHNPARPHQLHLLGPTPAQPAYARTQGARFRPTVQILRCHNDWTWKLRNCTTSLNSANIFEREFACDEGDTSANT